MKTNNEIVAFGVDGWMREVKNRPLRNVHRRTLDTTWRQAIRFGGGDPDELVGPSHDDLLAENPTHGHRDYGCKWYLGSLNDGLFIVNKKPQADTDYVNDQSGTAPDVALNVVKLSREQAQAIVDAHNATLQES